MYLYIIYHLNLFVNTIKANLANISHILVYDILFHMKIISWNVNGIRAWVRKEAHNWMLKQKPDIFCLQETKAHPEQLTKEVLEMGGYYSYFDSSQVKKGYSGVAIYSKVEPEKVTQGIGKKEFDTEGRTITAYFKDFILVNCYFPNGGGGPERLAYKLAFYKEFLKYIEKLRKKKPVIFCGDVNTAHFPVDLARPKENEKSTGFLPEERAWIDGVVEKGYIDVFRYTYPKKENMYTYWDMKTFARDRNVGWRIDYFFIAKEFLKQVKGIKINDDVLGSDHCPITLTLK